MNKRARIAELTEQLFHAERLHRALLIGYDAIEENHAGARLASEMLASENDRLDHKIATIRAYADNLTASGSSAYRKAGTRLLEILDDGDTQAEDAAMTG